MTEIACVVEAHDALGECCLWCPVTRRVWWLDIQKPCLQSYDPASREHRVYPLPGKHCGCAALRKSGGLVLALDNGLHGFDPATGKLNFLVHAEPDEPGNRYNDGRCDRRGRLWIGTMDIGIRRASGSFYRIGADRSVLRLFDGITVPNSTAFSPDDRTLYFADTPRHVIWAFDFNLHAGMIGERRVFADLTARKGLPDGSCVDAEGFLWNAEYGGHRPDALRAGRPHRPHHRAAGDQSDLLLLRRRQSRHPLCHQRDGGAEARPDPSRDGRRLARARCRRPRAARSRVRRISRRFENRFPLFGIML